MKCKISIITVCYNSISTIEQTINSVLSQTYPNIEYIVIDGGSEDGTVDVIKKYNSKISKWISEPDKGIYDAMNKGIKYATGDWVHFRNCGDYFVSKDTLKLIFSQPIEPNVSVIHGNCYYVNSDGYILTRPQTLTNSYKNIMPVLHPASFVKTDVQKSNPFDLTYKSSADYNLFYRLCEENIKMKYVDIAVSTYDEGGWSSNWVRAYREDLRIQGVPNNFYGKCYILFKICRKKLNIFIHDVIIKYVPFVKAVVIKRRIKNKLQRQPLPFPFDY